MNFEEFESLDLESQKKVFRETPYKEKGELLLHSHDPRELTRALSLEEFYLVTKDMDAEERAEILRFANLPQLLFLGDLDCWQKDRIDPKGLTLWLESLIQADPRILLVWLVESDYATVIAGFQKLAHVTKPEWEYATDEALGDVPVFTLDQFYYIHVKEENLETVRQALQILFENHRGRYVALMEGLVGEINDELEEEAFQRRQMRLAERGFPDPESAHQIYRPLSPEDWDAFPPKDRPPGEAPEGLAREAELPHYPVLRENAKLLLDQVLLVMRQENYQVQEGIEEELAWVSNKVLACDGFDISSEERILKGIERARSLVNLGLELLSGGDLARARTLVKEKWLEMIFRWGVTEVLHLREEAETTVRRYWGNSWEAMAAFMDPPYENVFRGLFRAPLAECYDEAVTENLMSLRDFRLPADLERTRRSVRQIEGVHGFLHRLFPDFFKRRREDAEEGPLFTILGTIYAWTVASGKPDLRPLGPEAIKRFVKNGFRTAGNRRVLDPEKKKECLGTFHAAAELALLTPLWGLVLDRVEDEFSRLNDTRLLDPRFISSLRVKRSEKKASAARGGRRRQAVRKK